MLFDLTSFEIDFFSNRVICRGYLDKLERWANHINYIIQNIIIHCLIMKAGGKRLKQKHIEDFLQDIEDFKFGEKSKMSL